MKSKKKMPSLHKDYTGTTVNRRQILRFSHFTLHNDPMWVVRCFCGNVFESLTQDLKRNTCRHCTNMSKRKRPFESLYNAFYAKASKKHRVDFSYEQFLEFTKTANCHYCDEPVAWLRYQTRTKGKKYKGQCYNLDRKDNALPYTVDNVVVCCSRCNLAKNSFFTYEEWKRVGDVIRKWRKESAESENHTKP